MSTSLWTKTQYAKCFGHWVVADPECTRCAVADSCEKRTKTKAADSKPSEAEGIGDEIHEEEAVSPVDYLLRSLDGKFDHGTEERDKAILHKFTKDGKLVIAIAVGAYGKVKIVSVVKNIQKVFGQLSSIEEVEEVLAEML
jgi:hypothetical protein